MMKIMSLPRFSDQLDLSSKGLRTLVVDRVRAERRRLGLSQSAFAAKCGIPLRTYKRFELDKCNSLDVLIKIIAACGRTKGLELLFFPADQVVELRTPTAALDRFKRNLSNRGE